MNATSSELDCLFLGNIGHDATHNGIKEFFTNQGVTIAGVDIKNGYAFVYVAREYNLDDVISRVQNKEFDRTGRVVVVQKSRTGLAAKEREERRRETLSPTDTLFICGVDMNRTQEEDIRYGFSKFGTIRDIEMKKAFCFVSYYSIEDATRAMNALNGSEWRGRILTIEYSKSTIRKVTHRDNAESSGHGRDDSRERMGGSRSGGRSTEGGNPGGHPGSAPYHPSGGPGGAMPMMHHDSVTQSAIRDREIADAFIRSVA
jgi:nucleolin